MPARLLSLCLLLCLMGLAPAQITKGKVAPRDLPFTPINKWAMVIGASDYKELGKLNYAAKDAEAFANVLKERFEFKPESIELITDNPDSTQKPTIERIDAALEEQLKDSRLDKGDLFIFYFSGHGIGTPKGDFLMPTDATAKDAEKAGLNVKGIVEQIVRRGLRNVIVIVDACRGGEKNEFGDDLRKLGKEANIAVLLSCEPGARSYEYPRLGHGAFTSFLIKNLKSTALVSETTGGLWASRVAKQVGDDVRAYTVRDYPNQPQMPSGWAEPTMDVLLGAFPTQGKARLKIADIMAETERLNRQEYADSLSRFGEQMFVADRYLEAIETWRALDSIRELTPTVRFCLAQSLNFAGKHLEADTEFAKLRKLEKSDPIRYVATLSDPSRRIKPSERVFAAKELWKISKEEWVGMLVWSSLELYASDADALSFLKEYLQEITLPTRLRLFYEGQIAGYSGDWNGAKEKWVKAKGEKDEFPTDKTLNASIFQALVQSGRTSEIEGFIKDVATSSGSKEAQWNLLLAQAFKEQRKLDKMMEQIHLALTKDLNPGDLLWALRLAGLRFFEIADKVAKRADEMPYVWKAMVAKAWVKSIGQSQEEIQKAYIECTKFCDDEFSVTYEWFRLLDETLEERFTTGVLPAETYAQLLMTYSSVMAAEVEKFGYDGEAWLLFSQFALLTEKFEQNLKLFDVYLGPLLDAGTIDPSLRAAYLFAAFQMNDQKRAAQIWKLGGIPAVDKVDSAWLMAMFLVCNGDLAGAKDILPKNLPSEALRVPALGFQIYLRVLGKEKVDLSKEGAKLEGSGAAMHWLALAYVEQGNWAKAMPILEKFLFERQLGFFFVQAKAARAYFDRLVQTRQFEKSNSIAYTIAISGYGNPLYHQIYYGEVANLEAFKGNIDLKIAEFEFLPEFYRGNLTLTIEADGTVRGNGVIEGKPREVLGKVDKYGNLVATVSEPGKSWTMSGKIAPPAYYKTLPVFETGVQAFLLLDEKGQARYALGMRPDRK